MILCISDAIDAELAAKARRALETGAKLDGRETAGWHARTVKNNRQLRAADAGPVAAEIVDALRDNDLFRAAAQPRRFTPLLLSSYEPGMSYGAHVDDALMGADPLRTDVAFTVFLAPPDNYAGGELVLESSAGEQAFKLEAGAAVVYPATTLHRVAEVTAGVREVAVGWVQSLVREADRRELLFHLDLARRSIFAREGKTADFDRLARTYANLLRMWAEP